MYGIKLIISKLDSDVLKAIENYKIEKGLLSPREGSNPRDSDIDLRGSSNLHQSEYLRTSDVRANISSQSQPGLRIKSFHLNARRKDNDKKEMTKLEKYEMLRKHGI